VRATVPGDIVEYPIARLYADARVTRIYGGASEVMKSIISKSLGLQTAFWLSVNHYPTMIGLSRL
jgi:Acyl-CoA dehydrogenase, C-terminal domain